MRDIRGMSVFKRKIRRFLSIDFSHTLVKIGYIESTRDSFRLINYDFKKISQPENNKAETVDFINKFRKSNSISRKEVYLTVPLSDSVVAKRINLPSVPKEEVASAAKWHLKEESTVNLDTAIFDWQIVAEHMSPEGAKRNEIMFVLANPEVIYKYLSIVGECQLQPLIISTAPFNYANILKHYSPNLKTVALIDVGDKDTTLCIYKGNKVNFIRKVSFSSEKTHAVFNYCVSIRQRPN